MNYTNTFIHVAPDTKAEEATAPVSRAGKKSIAVLEYELISGNPYTYTQEEVQFAVYTQRQGIPARDLKARRTELWREYFSRPRACMRCSPLAKIYGWGLHFNTDGKVALVAVESTDYKHLASSRSVRQTQAMRSRRT
ncbi:MAG TPA: DUF6157 family protein [Burkholderiales bacterium]|nr:DUF6157 family protein [Burkholderiales bacterium]